MKKLIILILGAYWGVFLSFPALAQQGDAAAGKTKSASCAACHGADGNSVNPEWPKLAGQIPEYIVKQLTELKTGRRANPIMSPMAQPLSAQDIADLAAYFGAQTVQPGVGKTELMALGEKIYHKGKHRPHVTACLGCHGPAGAGNREWAKKLAAAPAVLAPAIGGQHAEYVAKQITAYQTGARKNDVGHVMRDITAHLTEQEITALAEYISTLRR